MNDENKSANSSNYSQKLWSTGRKHAADTWYQSHCKALNHPRVGFETALVSMLQGWLHYADTHGAHFGSTIGADGVLGEHWAAIGQGLRGLLNGETGRLDCGCLDSILGETLESEGIES
jgi:hypothetical protein